MKLFSAIADAAVIGASISVVDSAESGALPEYWYVAQMINVCRIPFRKALSNCCMTGRGR